MGKEKNFENRIKKYLDNLDGWHVKFFANAFTKSGIPDILVCLNGKFVAIEVKQETGTPSDLQEYHLRDIIKKGGIGILAYPSGFTQLKFILNLIKQNKPIDQYIDSEKGYIECVIKKSKKT